MEIMIIIIIIPAISVHLTPPCLANLSHRGYRKVVDSHLADSLETSHQLDLLFTDNLPGFPWKETLRVITKTYIVLELSKLEYSKFQDITYIYIYVYLVVIPKLSTVFVDTSHICSEFCPKLQGVSSTVQLQLLGIRLVAWSQWTLYDMKIQNVRPDSTVYGFSCIEVNASDSGSASKR